MGAVAVVAAMGDVDGVADDDARSIDVVEVAARMYDWPGCVRVGRIDVTTECTDSEVWLTALFRRRSVRLFEVIDKDTRNQIRRESMAGRVGEQERVEAFQVLLEQVTGRPWYQAENLAIMTLGAWRDMIGPALTAAGWSAGGLSISQLLDFSYWTMERVFKAEDWSRMRTSLNSQPADAAPEDPDDMVMDADAFRRAASRL